MAHVECAKFGFGEGEYWVLIPENLEENCALTLIQCDNRSVFLRSLSWRGVTINILISNSQEAISGTLQPLASVTREFSKKFEQLCQKLIGHDRGILFTYILDIANEPIIKHRFDPKKKTKERRCIPWIPFGW